MTLSEGRAQGLLARVDACDNLSVWKVVWRVTSQIDCNFVSFKAFRHIVVDVDISWQRRLAKGFNISDTAMLNAFL